MNSFRFGRITVLSVFILLVIIINGSYSASIPDKDDLFTINVTMKNFQTTRVYIYKNKIRFFFKMMLFFF
jgi:hypothetical protein